MIDWGNSKYDFIMAFIEKADFFNFLARKHSYPDAQKILNLTPVHNRNSQENIEKYRLVSVLSNMS